MAVFTDTVWRYVLRGYWHPAHERNHKTVFFSQWNDTVAFVGVTGRIDISDYFVAALRVPNVYISPWSDSGSFGFSYFGDKPLIAYSFRSAGTVYAWTGEFFRSSDNGISWEWRSFPPLGYSRFFLHVNQFADSQIYAGVQFTTPDMFRLYLSTDEGSTWELKHMILDDFSNADMLAVGDTLILSTSFLQTNSNCGIYRSSDFGTTWFQTLSNVRAEGLASNPNDRDEIYAATRLGVYRSIDAGETWQLYNNAIPSLNLVDIAKDPYSDTIYVATGDSGVFQVFDFAVDVQEQKQLPPSYSLSQNYPNPFNPSTVVRYQLPEASYVTLRVYDVLGREVKTLVNEVKEVGYHEVALDAASLASGIYIYRMTAGEFVQSRKFVVMK